MHGTPRGERHARVLSSGAVVVRAGPATSSYLVLRAFRYWDFPKGEVEPGEDPLAAALREVREETGLEDLEVLAGGRCHETRRYGRGKVARYHLVRASSGEVRLPVSPELGRPEHHEHRWLPYAKARVLLVPRVAAALDWAHGIITGHEDWPGP